MFKHERALISRALGSEVIPFALTYGSIFRVIIILAAIWLLYHIIDVVAVLFFGIIVASTITPSVDRLKKEGVPRVLGALFIYLCMVIAFAFIAYIIVPETIIQLSKVSSQLPHLIERYLGSSSSLSQDILAKVRESIAGAASGIGVWLFGLVGGLGNVVLVFIISFYLTVEDRVIKDFLRVTLPVKHQEYILDLVSRSQRTLSSWLKSQLILMFMVGVLTFIGFWIIGVPFKLVLAIMAGLFEIIPFAGPVIAAVPAIIFSLQISPGTALLTALLFFVVQQVESNILTPLVVKRTLDINPILAILALFVGAKLGGIIGILAAIPLLALFLEFSKDYLRKEETDVTP